MRVLASLSLFVGIVLSGCESSPREDGPIYCVSAMMVNSAALTFDGSALAGQQVQLLSDGALVWDSCQGGALAGSSADDYGVYVQGRESAVVRFVDSYALPSGESLELRSSPDCSMPWVSHGVAAVTYSFERTSLARCLGGGEYLHDEQDILFQ